jgi:hypothetical protein
MTQYLSLHPDFIIHSTGDYFTHHPICQGGVAKKGRWVMISLSDLPTWSYHYDYEKRNWGNDHFIFTEKSSFYLLIKMREFNPAHSELTREYSVIKFLLTKEIFIQNHLPRDVLILMIDLSD